MISRRMPMPTIRELVNGELPARSVLMVIMAVVFGLFTIHLELVFQIPLKLTGHRALPGAFTLLVFAEAFVPLAVIGFAALVSTCLVTLQLGTWSLIWVWLLAATMIISMRRWRAGRIERRILYHVFCGIGFGALLWLSKPAGLHHTPELIRAGGHMLFGCFGGVCAFGLAGILKTNREKGMPSSR